MGVFIMKKKPIIITAALSLIALCSVCTYLIKKDSPEAKAHIENASTEDINYTTLSNGNNSLIKEETDNSTVPNKNLYYSTPSSDVEARDEYNTLTNGDTILIKEDYTEAK